MNGYSTVHFAEAISREQARQAERHAAENQLLVGVAPSHPLQARFARGLIKLGTWLTPRATEPPHRPSTSPPC